MDTSDSKDNSRYKPSYYFWRKWLYLMQQYSDPFSPTLCPHFVVFSPKSANIDDKVHMRLSSLRWVFAVHGKSFAGMWRCWEKRLLSVSCLLLISEQKHLLEPRLWDCFFMFLLSLFHLFHCNSFLPTLLCFFFCRRCFSFLFIACECFLQAASLRRRSR